jgi:hypothetical protein
MDSYRPRYDREAFEMIVETPGFPDVWVADGELAECYQLIRWLARPYGNNTPVFEAEGTDLSEMRLLRDLYRRATGTDTIADRAELVWCQCDHCGAWSTKRKEVIDV